MAYVEITKEDIEKFFKTRYRAFKPKLIKDTFAKNELVYDLYITKTITVRIYTSILTGGGRAGKGASKGKDSMKALLFAPKIKKPLNKKAGKSIVKRTASWKKSLSDRIDSFVEEYYNREDFYNAISIGKKPEEKKIETPSMDIKKQEEPKPQPSKPGKPKTKKEMDAEYIDNGGNFRPEGDYKEKYIKILQDLVDNPPPTFPDYMFTFTESLIKQMKDKGYWTQKQKASVDKTIKFNRIKFLTAKSILGCV